MFAIVLLLCSIVPFDRGSVTCSELPVNTINFTKKKNIELISGELFTPVRVHQQINYFVYFSTKNL